MTTGGDVVCFCTLTLSATTTDHSEPVVSIAANQSSGASNSIVNGSSTINEAFFSNSSDYDMTIYEWSSNDSERSVPHSHTSNGSTTNFSVSDEEYYADEEDEEEVEFVGATRMEGDHREYNSYQRTYVVCRACMHMFHTMCVDKWLESHTTFPACRTDLTVSIPI